MNELTTVPSAPAPSPLLTPSRASVFDDASEFEKALRMADALAKTSLIPANFQGKPADCLIALDYGRRLGLSPVAVLPHLYVIQGRPATSAQFMIALVNRSGAFTRIQWDEGIDGEVEYAFNNMKRTAPNYYAVARFTEIASGTEYASPRVDLRFALANGWLTKNDSKWQKTPQVMCRYRSASILIKTVCPELAMGMEFYDDLGDGRDGAAPGLGEQPQGAPPLPLGAVQHSAVAGADDEAAVMQGWLDRVDRATSLEELTTIGRQVADWGFSESSLQRLRDAFKARRAELNDAAPEKSKKGRGRKAAQRIGLDELRAAIAKAQSEEVLRAVEDAASLALTTGRITSDEFASLDAAIKSRSAELPATPRDGVSANYCQDRPDARCASLSNSVSNANGGAPCSSSPNQGAAPSPYEAAIAQAEATDEMKDWARELCAAIAEASTPDVVDSQVEAAREWAKDGRFARDLLFCVEEFAKERKTAL